MLTGDKKEENNVTIAFKMARNRYSRCRICRRCCNGCGEEFTAQLILKT